MIWLFALCASGLPAAFLLMRRVPLCPPGKVPEDIPVSVVIPARNEEHNLALLLNSIAQSESKPGEVIVVDDASADRTAEVAESYGARVISPENLPGGWTGKTWACHQGALAAGADVLLFLDADTRFDTNGYERVASLFLEGNREDAISILPFHVTQKPYEELSIFFHLLMAMGASGFGSLGKPHLFGQCLMISKKTYELSGGHRSVREHILENFALSSRVYAAGLHCVTRGGRGALNIRMFPHGFAQLCEGWSKAFADGAATSPPVVLAVAIWWIAAALSSFLFVLFPGNSGRAVPLAVYFSFVLQLVYLSRQIGNYRLVTCLLYPVPLMFYFAVFGQSFYRRVFKRRVAWRGREV